MRQAFNSITMCVNINCSILPIALCRNGALRVTGGPTSMAGYLEVCYNEVWGSVCSSNWDNTDAGVACRQLGFAPVGKNEGDIQWIFYLIQELISSSRW